MKDGDGCGMIFACFALGAFAGFLATMFLLTGGDNLVVEAVELGHAEYYLDDNHQRQWRWKEPCK